MRSNRYREREAGLTLLELMVTLSIIMILASMVIPFSKMAARRAKEYELHQTLRTIREAIDEFHQDFLTIPYKGSTIANDIAGESGYPKSLDILVKGVKNPRSPKETVTRYLRKIPIDPMTKNAEWGLRCNSDEPDSENWCGDDVYDVYSKSSNTAIDKTKYRDW
ncbi:MAG: type II secretion system protein [Nitrospirae bacterium]|nr:type II secretion system protein [Nitrospirota bacterium]MBI3594823.1 type II secretion system protein [Nitrospirota bacterium]